MRALLRPVAPFLWFVGTIAIFDLMADSAVLSRRLLFDNEIWRFQVATMMAGRIPTLAGALALIATGAWLADRRGIGRGVMVGGMVLVGLALAAGAVLIGFEAPLLPAPEQSPLTFGPTRLRGLVSCGAALILIPLAIRLGRPSRWDAAA
ncbi:MAG: hypothetical protein SFV24_03670 [Gemmatimonadales bacterium]|nr:hypothetical protein [Gemmatimonadales bacterium]